MGINIRNTLLLQSPVQEHCGQHTSPSEAAAPAAGSPGPDSQALAALKAPLSGTRQAPALREARGAAECSTLRRCESPRWKLWSTPH